MSKDSQEEANPWQNLATITSFDKDNSRTTRTVREDDEGAVGGQVIGHVVPSTSLLIESLLKNICTMFEPDLRTRNKLYSILCEKLYAMKLIDDSYNMLEFESLRGEYQEALCKMVKVARAATGSENIIESPSFSPISRYSNDFDELEFIASGGFGSVYRAIHHLDGHEYAIKKIIVRLSHIKRVRRQLEEVKTLARLNHSNIVAYKGAWIEYKLPDVLHPPYSNDESSPRQSNSSSSSSSSSTESSSSETSSKSSKSKTSSSSDHADHETESPTGSRIADDTSNSSEKENSDVVSFRNDDTDDTDNDRSISSDSCDIEQVDENRLELESVTDGKICAYNTSMKSQYATLYIQMSFCERTLRSWLDDRSDVTPEPITTMILKQILDGLHYIHSRGVVHHDIKPSNIFIAVSEQSVEIQVGDFGLACPLQSENHGPIFGTELYVAPEQLRGECNLKSDLYSLGIVAFEILFPMRTAMERDKLVRNLKGGKMPESFIAKHPKWAETIKKLVHNDPDQRPSTSDLLRDFHEDKETIITKLENSNREKDSIIKDLKNKIKRLETYVKSLKEANNDRQ